MVTDEPPSPRVNHFLKQMEAWTDIWKDNQRMSSEPVPLTAEGLAAGPGLAGQGQRRHLVTTGQPVRARPRPVQGRSHSQGPG
ncbi:unnamed protein product [Gadus morhua 'NCC']